MKAIVVHSGGQDSTTCLYKALYDGYDVHAVTFDYGQRHRRELYAARHICHRAGVSHEIITLGRILQGTSPLVSINELDEYSDYRNLPGGLEKTFVPMRNQLFLTIAANRAYVTGAQALFTGVCQEDYGGYPDCRAVFIQALSLATNLGTFTDQGLEIITPLMFLSKAAIVDLAMNLPGCYEALAFSHTSYAGEWPPSSKDHASLLRAKGFEEAGIPDPLLIRAFLQDEDYELPDTKNYVGIAEFIERIRRVI